MMTGLRSMVRQDPDVIMVGEIRDRDTAETVFQASLIGNLVLTTFHAGSCTRALSRLNDMGIEPYLIRSGLLIAFCQRLLRRLCTCREIETVDPSLTRLGLDTCAKPVGCEKCRGTGYWGRAVISEMLNPDEPLVAQSILKRLDVMSLEEVALKTGMINLRSRGVELVRQQVTSLSEVIRVLGSELVSLPSVDNCEGAGQ